MILIKPSTFFVHITIKKFLKDCNLNAHHPFRSNEISARLKRKTTKYCKSKVFDRDTPLTSVRSCLICHVLNVTSISLIVLVFALLAI